MCCISVDAVVLILTLAVLISASVRDIRSREVSDRHWAALGIMAIASAAISGDELSIVRAAGLMFLSSYILSPRLVGIPGTAVLVAGLATTALSGLWTTASMYILILVLYHMHLIRGGADAKALMCISMLFPTYPEIPSIPILIETVPEFEVVLNPVMGVIVTALVISLLAAIRPLYLNLRDGAIGRNMFSCYRMDMDEAENSFVWPIEDIVDGEVIRTGIPDDAEQVYGRLKEAGRDDVLVTPMIPFLVSITFAFVFVTVFGNPMFLII